MASYTTSTSLPDYGLDYVEEVLEAKKKEIKERKCAFKVGDRVVGNESLPSILVDRLGMIKRIEENKYLYVHFDKVAEKVGVDWWCQEANLSPAVDMREKILK